jgi:hypothetical protein
MTLLYPSDMHSILFSMVFTKSDLSIDRIRIHERNDKKTRRRRRRREKERQEKEDNR